MGWLIRFFLWPLTLRLSSGGGGTPPAPPVIPNPADQIKAEANVNRYNIVGPNGSQFWQGPDAGQNTLIQTLSPSQDRQLEGRNAVAESMIGNAGTRADQLPTSPLVADSSQIKLDWSPDRANQVQDAYWGNQKKLLDTQWNMDEERERQRLTNQGIPEGSEAYNVALNDFTRRKSDAYSTAANNAVVSGGQEQSRLFGEALNQGQFATGERDASFNRNVTARNQAYNELASLLSGNQISAPPAAAQPVDTSGAFANAQAARNTAYNGQIAGYNAGVAGNNSLMNGLFGLGAAYLRGTS